jgi:hypothetical protein
MFERFGISIWIIIHRLYILGIHSCYTSSVHSYLRSISTAEAPGWFYLDWIGMFERFGISIWIIIHRLYILGIHSWYTSPSILTYGPFRRRWRPVGFIWIEFYTPRDFHFISFRFEISRTFVFYLIILPGFRPPTAVVVYILRPVLPRGFRPPTAELRSIDQGELRSIDQGELRSIDQYILRPFLPTVHIDGGGAWLVLSGLICILREIWCDVSILIL